jgi:propionyl-CoA carboxylase beta chain
VEIIFRGDIGDKDKIAARTKEYEANFANPFKAANLGFVDDVILPHTTRARICRSLAMLKTKDIKNPWKKHANIPL